MASLQEVIELERDMESVSERAPHSLKGHIVVCVTHRHIKTK